MTHKQKELYISLLICAFCFCVYAFQLKGYLLLETFLEAKYVSSAFCSIFSFTDIFSPKLNGVPYFELGPLYYLLLEASALIFRGFSVFSARFPSVVVSFATIIGIYFLTRRMFNKRFAVTASFSSVTTVGFIIFSCISSPSMIASCLATLSVLFGITPLFIEHEGHKKLYFLAFWIFLTLAVLTQGLSGMVMPLITMISVYAIFRRLSDFSKPKHFFPGFCTFLVTIAIWLTAVCLCNDASCLSSTLFFVKPKMLLLGSSYGNFLGYFLLFIFVGFLPWFFDFISVSIEAVRSFRKDFKDKNEDNFRTNNDKKFLFIMLFASCCSVILYLIYGITDFARLLPAVYFGTMAVSYYWYKAICFGEGIKSVQLPSVLFYISLISFSLFVIFAYFFVSPDIKVYIEDLIVPIVSLTLLVAMPGIISVVLNRNVLNYSMHLILSVLLFFISTGSLYDYVNSFGTKDLADFAIKAKKDNAILVTFGVKNKYVMTYYYGNPVIFNDLIPTDEVYNKYGESQNIYIVVKLTDLAYFDRLYSYDVVKTGKHYCEITNIKHLPKSEIEEDDF